MGKNAFDTSSSSSAESSSETESSSYQEREAKRKQRNPKSKKDVKKAGSEESSKGSSSEESTKSNVSETPAVDCQSEEDSELKKKPVVGKIRIVPLEKLLATPSKKIRTKITPRRNLESVSSESTQPAPKKPSPRPSRRSSNKSPIIELSDSAEDLKDEELLIPLVPKPLVSKATAKSSDPKPKPKPATKKPTLSVKRCLVRLKRVSLPKSGQTNRKMSSDSEPEAATTSKKSRPSRRSKSESEEDSDYEAPATEEEEGEDLDERKSEDENENKEDEEAANNSSDSEVMPQRKRRKQKSDSDKGSSDFEPEQKQKKKKRKRIKNNSSEESDGDDEKAKNKRKHIRKIIKTKDLDVSTKEAGKEEEDRRKRIEERQKLYNRIFEKSENVEITELVLDFDEESKKALLQVDKGLLKKLKPHQVAGVKFMWDACFETLKDSQEKAGSGCILAHCMGLGKTLQVVTLSHTLLSNTRRTNVDRVLVISPLSTVNNWAREFVQWMKFANRKNIEVYDISRYKDKPTRIFKLNEWFTDGGVCILGYDMYRILANEKAKGLRKKQREQLQQALVDPGPDLVVCDEGHLLKNEKTSISKAVTRMRTKRRIVLTGTPLQNNLRECKLSIELASNGLVTI